MAAIVEGPKIAALSCGKPAYLVVLLHGPGSTGQAMIAAGDFLTAFVTHKPAAGDDHRDDHDHHEHEHEHH